MVQHTSDSYGRGVCELCLLFAIFIFCDQFYRAIGRLIVAIDTGLVVVEYLILAKTVLNRRLVL